MTKFYLRLDTIGLVSVLLLWANFSFAQKCATLPFNNKQGQGEENKQVFEAWIQKKLAQNKSIQSANRTQADEIYTIPVVVHIINRGESEGVGSNISYEQVVSQIEVLNQDYRRLNADTTNTPDDFKPVAADIGVEFVLAKQDPDGFATNGVVRATGAQSSYSQSESAELSALSYWDSENYLNIWVTTLSNDILGFASFPVTDLEGIESSTPAEEDGIVIDYRYFGSSEYGSSINAGRTATHEIGHYLGLRHIWGDGGCNVDDYVEDTPLQGSSTSGCPEEKTSCGVTNMFQNYMDYTNDACMNIFTEGQKERMRIVMEESIRRNSLLTSPGLQEPVLADNDGSINRVISPGRSICNEEYIPEISLLNVGENVLESAEISVYLNETLVETRTFSINLETGESQNISFSPINTLSSVPQQSSYDLTFAITSVNNVTDENDQNDIRSIAYTIPTEGTLPLSENFEDDTSTFLDDAVIRNDDTGITWEVTDAPGFGEGNQALFMNFYDYSSLGAEDYLFTPTYDFGTLSSATLSFRYAYAPYVDPQSREISEDGLAIGISFDCGATIDTLIFEETGEDLASVSGTADIFTPIDRTEWSSVELSLEAFAGQSNIQIVFIGINDYGNNLYLDDIQITEVTPIDVSVREMVSPGLITASQHVSPVVSVGNDGSTTLNNYRLIYNLDGTEVSNFTYNAFPITSGDTMQLPLVEEELALGLHNITIELTEPNSEEDPQPQNNTIDYHFYIDNQQDIVPLLQNFDDTSIPDVLNGESPNSQQEWLVANPDNDTTWILTPTEREGTTGMSAVIQNFYNNNLGSIDQLVSPLLDFSNVREASVFFDASYGLFDVNFTDTLRLLISLDSGESYRPILDISGDQLSQATVDSAWAPSVDEDWQRYFVDLTEFAGNSGIRLAFEAVNAYGNNIYLDNIEFFQSNDEDPVSVTENTYLLYPNPSEGNLSAVFNLEQREDVQIILYNIRGSLIWKGNFPNTLNQTYDIDMAGHAAGVYLMRVISASVNSTQKFIIH